MAQAAGLDEDRALERSEVLGRHSLVYLDSTGLGPRTRMLETVREFVAERLAARPDAAEAAKRHAGYYRALAEQADRPHSFNVGTHQNSPWARFRPEVPQDQRRCDSFATRFATRDGRRVPHPDPDASCLVPVHQREGRRGLRRGIDPV